MGPGSIIYLKRSTHPVVQWTLGYLAGAWVLLEVFSNLQEGLGWPQRPGDVPGPTPRIP